jgi:hypothetical protein
MDAFPICGYHLSPGQFSSQDWQSYNAIDANGRLISKVLKPVFYLSLDGTLYEIPPFQPTDYASAPPALWGPPLFLIPYGWWSLPALGHDSAFQNSLLAVNSDGLKHLAFPGADTEGACNVLLLEMMKAIKPNPTTFEKLQMDAIYEGVTIGGWHAFKEDRG